MEMKHTMTAAPESIVLICAKLISIGTQGKAEFPKIRKIMSTNQNIVTYD